MAFELDQGLLPGGVRHPGEVLDVVRSAVSSAATIFDVRSLPSAPKVFSNVALAQRLAELVCRRSPRSASSAPQLPGLAQELVVEGEALVHEGRGQQRGGSSSARQRR